MPFACSLDLTDPDAQPMTGLVFGGLGDVPGILTIYPIEGQAIPDAGAFAFIEVAQGHYLVSYDVLAHGEVFIILDCGADFTGRYRYPGRFLTKDSATLAGIPAATVAGVQTAILAGAGNAQVSSPLPSQCGSGYLLTLKRGDTLPSVALHLLDGSGNPVSLPAGTSVQFHMGTGGRVKVNQPATIVDAATALVQYAWADGDTSVAGLYAAEFQLTFPDGSVETWPNQGSLSVHIIADIA